MTQIEKWLYRAKCPCGVILWIDAPAAVWCACAKSHITAEGALINCSEATDEEMIDYILKDCNRVVSLQCLQ